MKRFTRRMIALIMTFALIVPTFAFAGCGPERDSSKLYVGMECGYAPFNYTQLDDANGAVKISNADGYANGYDVMIAKKIAEDMGKELVIVKYEWDALIPAIISGSLDFIIAGMSPTDERKESIAFSDAYYESQLVVVVRKDGAYANAKSLSDLSGAKIVAQLGTFHDSALQAQAGKYGIVADTPLKTFPLMINALNVKGVDGYVAEEPGAIADCSANPDFTYIKLTNNQTGFEASAEDVQIAIGMKKDSANLQAINSALAKISAEERLTLMQRATEYAVED